MSITPSDLASKRPVTDWRAEYYKLLGERNSLAEQLENANKEISKRGHKIEQLRQKLGMARYRTR